MQADIVIRGGKVVTADAVFEADVAIAGEKIVALGEALQGNKTIDAKGRYVLPGAIDSHVHFRTPGYDYKEDWQTGTGAAARGGVTTVLEMPNTRPPTGTLAALKEKQAIAARQAYVDYGIYGLLDEENIGELEALVDAGVSGFKCFMGNTFGDLPAPSDGAMLEGFEILARRGMRCTVHAENPSIMARRQARLEAAGRTDPLAHLAARPEVCAIEAVSRAVVFAEWTGARLHIAHKSSKDALYVLRDAKRRGVDVTVEERREYAYGPLISHLIGYTGPVTAEDLLELLLVQDKMANRAKDVSGLVLGRKMRIPAAIAEDFLAFVRRCIVMHDAPRVALRGNPC